MKNRAVWAVGEDQTGLGSRQTLMRQLGRAATETDPHRLSAALSRPGPGPGTSARPPGAGNSQPHKLDGLDWGSRWPS